MIIAALLGALTFGACVDSEESASVTAVRNAKAEQLKSVATLNNAKAQAEATLAAAQAQLAAAQAQLLAAEAAALNATTEAQKIANQIAAAQAAQKIAEIEAEMEIAAIKYQMDLAKAALEFNKNSESLLVELNKEYVDALKAHYTAQKNLAAMEVALAKAEKAAANAETDTQATLDVLNAALAKINGQKAELQAKIAAYAEVSDLGSISTIEKLNETIVAAEAAANTAYADYLVANNAYTSAKGAGDKYNLTKKNHAYSKAYDKFTKNNILGTLVDKSIKSKIDNVEFTTDYLAFETYKWDISNAEISKTGDKVALFNAEYTDNFDIYGNRSKNVNKTNNDAYETEVDYNDVTINLQSYTGRVYYYDIVAENVEAYAAEVENYIALTYDAALANAESKLDLIAEQIEEAELDEKVEAIMSDYEMVVEAIAETELAIEEAQRELATLKYFKDTYYPNGGYDEEDDNESGLKDSTYEDYCEQIADLEKEIADLEKFLNVELTEDFIKDFEWEYNSTSLNAFDGLKDTKEEIEEWFNDEDVESGFFTGSSDKNKLVEKWFNAATEMITLETNYDNAVTKAGNAVAALETMVAEYENWVAYAITEYNAKQSVPAVAYYEVMCASVDVNITNETYNYYMALANQWNTTGSFGQANDSLIAEINKLKADISDLENKTHDTNVSKMGINQLKKLIAGTSVDANVYNTTWALVQAQNNLAAAQYDLAIAEANLTAAKAALDAVLAAE